MGKAKSYLVRVIVLEERIIEVQAETPHQAKQWAARRPGVKSALDAWLPEEAKMEARDE